MPPPKLKRFPFQDAFRDALRNSGKKTETIKGPRVAFYDNPDTGATMSFPTDYPPPHKWKRTVL